MKNFSVSEWVQLFTQIGLTEKQMSDWHRLFEQQFPEAHQSFLEWLQLDSAKINAMRKKYQR